MKQYIKVLSVAGSDSSGGAGVQADIKAISACGAYSATVITALTAQNTVGVRAIHVPPVEVFEAQLDAVLSDISFDAMKIGMLPSVEYATVLAAKIQEYKIQNIVLDPVMVATSKDKLISDEAAQSVISLLLPLASVVTPNIPEAEYISGMEISSLEDFSLVASKIRALGAKNILIKGGHAQGNTIVDRLFTPTNDYSFSYDYNLTKNTHGTGCSLSSALATYLAHGLSVEDAVAKADDYLHEALIAGADYCIGLGHGPVNHFSL